MKWLNRIVQGFSPGECPHQNRPERAAETMGRDRNATIHSNGKYSFYRHICELAVRKRTSRSSSLPGLLDITHPGLKPWAVLFRHFMADHRSINEFAALDCAARSIPACHT
jgi:hypothetical protein